MTAEPAPERAERPVVWLNCAASLDGRLAFAQGARARLSSAEDLARVHRLRAEVDGIVVGVGTVLLDDPSLHVRWELTGAPAGTPPTRVVLDSHGRLLPASKVLDTSAPTIVATSERGSARYPGHVRTVVAGRDRVEIPRLWAELHRLGLRRLLVEGGAEVLASVVRSGRFDRWTIYYAPVAIGGTTAPPVLSGPESRGFDEAVRLELVGLERLGEGFVATFVPPRKPPG